MSLRERLTKLEALVKPPATSVCIHRGEPGIGEWIRASVNGDVPELERIHSEWDRIKRLGECSCEECRKWRERQQLETDPQDTELRLTLEGYESRAATNRVREPAAGAGALSVGRESAGASPADPGSALP